MNVTVSRLLLPHINPFKLNHFVENEASWLVGMEKFLTFKLKFEVNIFTIIQKEYLKLPIKEKSYMMGSQLIVGPKTYELLIKKAKTP